MSEAVRGRRKPVFRGSEARLARTVTHVSSNRDGKSGETLLFRAEAKIIEKNEKKLNTYEDRAREVGEL